MTVSEHQQRQLLADQLEVELGGAAGSALDLWQCKRCCALVSFPYGAAQHHRWHVALADALPLMVQP